MTGAADRIARVRPWAFWVATVAGLIAASTTGWLVWSHVTNLPGNSALPPVLTGSTALFLWAVWMRRRGETFRPQLGIGVSAIIAVALGWASYGPCAAGSTPFGVLIGILNLFTGQVEGALIGPDAADPACRSTPLVFQLARVFGLATLVFSALAVLATLARPAVDRLRIRSARVVDAVIGLDATTFPLVKALCDQRDQRPRRPTWYVRRWRLADRAPWTHPRSTVVVVHTSDSDPLVAAARSLGALVYVGVPSDPAVLRGVMLFWGRWVTIHRLYAVTDSQHDNVRIIKEAHAIIADRRPQRDTGWLSRNTVPRLIARFTDAREAREWRLRNVSSTGCFLDAVTPDGLLARTLVDRLAEYEATELLVSGDTPLAVSILDEVAQQRAFRHQLQSRRDQPHPADDLDAANRVAQLGFHEVVLLADTSDELCTEWRASRAPGAAVPTLLEPVAKPADWGTAVSDAAGRGGRPALIITDSPSPLVSARATRLSVRHPELLVLRPSTNVHGVERLSGVDGSAAPGSVVVRFGATLVDEGSPPDDTWTVLARQQHEVFCGRRSDDPAGQPPSRWVWEAGPGGLPDFFREDNLRQHRHLLMLVEEQGYRWQVARTTVRAPELPREVVAAVAEREHQRWCDFRLRTGWRPPVVGTMPPKKWLDENRRNANLVAWGSYDAAAETKLQRYNIDDLYKIIERLRLWGVEPWPNATDASAR